MDSKQIGKLIYDLDLGKFNNKTKLFESNNKDNWWIDEESFNTIKYHPLNSNTNNLLYKNVNNIQFDFTIKEWLILKINLKNKRSYKENDKSTMYRFFEDPKSQYGVFTYENIDPQCIEFYKEVKL